MSEKIAELRAMSDEQLIDNHDRLASGTVIGTRHYLDELRHRDAAHSEARMIDLTAQIRTLTLVVTALTVVNVVLVAWAILKPPG